MPDEAPNKTDRTLNRSGDPQTLRGVVGDDIEDLDIFGYEVVYTTGDFTVDREALLAKAMDVGIPEWMLPGATAPHHAFGYAIDDLMAAFGETTVDGQTVTFIADQNDSRYSYSVDARIYFPPEMTDTDDGLWRTEELGVIKYSNPDEGAPRVRFVDRIREGESLRGHWEAIRAKMEELYALHKASHRGKDVNNMTYYLTTQWTDSIKLRNACYFVPATHEYSHQGEVKPIGELIDAFTALYEWLDAHKHDPASDLVDGPTHAQQTEMNVIEIMDTDRQRKMVERKVAERLDGMAEEMAANAVDALRDDDAVAEEVAAEVSATLEDLRDLAGEYDDLLDGGKKRQLKTENAVERAVTDALGALGAEEADLAAAVIEDADVEVTADG
jgi:hypothetical protein